MPDVTDLQPGPDTGATAQLGRDPADRRRRRHHPARRAAGADGRALHRGAAGQRAEALQHRTDQPADARCCPCSTTSSTWPTSTSSKGWPCTATPPGDRPGRSCRPATTFPPGGPGIAARIVPGLTGAPTALPRPEPTSPSPGRSPKPPYRLPVGGGVGSTGSSRSTAARRPAREVLGWANTFEPLRPGSTATLSYDTPPPAGPVLGGQTLLWLLVLGYLFRTRVRAQAARDRVEIEAEGGAGMSRAPRRRSVPPLADRCWCWSPSLVGRGRGPAPARRARAPRLRPCRPAQLQPDGRRPGARSARPGTARPARPPARRPAWPSRPSSSQNASTRPLTGQIKAMTDAGKSATRLVTGRRPATTSTSGCPT